MRATSHLSPQKNIQHSKIICEILKEKLNVPLDRTLINFQALNPDFAGFNRTTVVKHLKKH